MFYEIRFCTAGYDSVLRDVIQYYEIRFCTTKNVSVLRVAILYYEIRFCSTRYDSVLRDTIMYYEIRFCETLRMPKCAKTAATLGNNSTSTFYKDKFCCAWDA
jgi:hypothetical protein